MKFFPFHSFHLSNIFHTIQFLRPLDFLQNPAHPLQLYDFLFHQFPFQTLQYPFPANYKNPLKAEPIQQFLPQLCPNPFPYSQ